MSQPITHRHLTRPTPAAPLLKQKSWSPDSHREELWARRKQLSGPRRTKSLTDEDLVELKACFELGFRFDSPEMESDSRLSNTLPALEFYYAVNRSYNDAVLKSRKSSSSPSLSQLNTASSSSSSTESDSANSSPIGSPLTLFSPGNFYFFLFLKKICINFFHVFVAYFKFLLVA